MERFFVAPEIPWQCGVMGLVGFLFLSGWILWNLFRDVFLRKSGKIETPVVVLTPIDLSFDQMLDRDSFRQKLFEFLGQTLNENDICMQDLAVEIQALDLQHFGVKFHVDHVVGMKIGVALDYMYESYKRQFQVA